MTPDVDLIAFGLSYHSDRHHAPEAFNERKWGGGFGLSWDHENGNWSKILSVGTYQDSYNNVAAFLMPGLRMTEKHWCFDMSAGLYQGSGFNGFGATASLGAHVYRGLWVHLTGTPAFFSGPTVLAVFLRYRI